MSQLFRIFLQARNFLLFIVLEILCIYLIRKNNSYWGVIAFDSSNYYAAKTLEFANGWKNYWGLFQVNEDLVKENLLLRKKYTDLLQAPVGTDASLYHPDSVFKTRFDFKVAKVINSSVELVDNYITIDKGTKDGIRPGMGVICPTGVVGQVMACTENFSRVYSILHSSYTLSAEVVNKNLRKDPNMNALGIAKWDGKDPKIIQLTTIDRFKPITKGDTVLTSQQNAIFPAGIPVGRIIRLSSEADDAFFKISVLLSTDFRGLSYVYIVDNKLKEEQELVEKTN